jgi:ERCC4-type nuclease
MTISPNARTIYLSPTEHDLAKVLPDAINSPLCEANGCDIFTVTSRGLLGWQRKTVADLEASLRDGRFHYQLAQIRSSSILAYRFLILEIDRRRTTTDGRRLIDSSLTVDGIRTVAVKCFLNDTLLIESAHIGETVAILETVSRYVEVGGGDRLYRPKPGGNAWGTRSSRDWAIHLLQSFPGIGPTTAAAIYDGLGVPFHWSVTEKDLTSIPGVGKVTARRLIDALAV